jgi:putative methionine-R-sulfoxide reductase with GAF domain
MGGDGEHSAVPKGCPKFASRSEAYTETLSQVSSVVTPNDDFVSSLSNASSILFYNLNAFANAAAPLHELPVNWCGFYLLTSSTELTLGPFQGKLACQKIKVGKGVCGTAVLMKQAQAVPDVHQVKGHIACDAGSESEVVVLIRNRTGSIVGLLDIDSTVEGFFSTEDVAPLQAICDHLGNALSGRFPIERETTLSGRPLATSAGADDDLTATRLPTKVAAVELRPGQTMPLQTRAPGAATTFMHHPPPSGFSPTAQTKPTTEVVAVGAWEFQSVQHNLMLRSAVFPEWEARFNVKMLPEIIFDENRLNFVCPLQGPPDIAANRPGARLGIARFHVSASEAIRSASEFYGTDTYRATAGDIAVPASAAWDKFRTSMQSFDPQIDWAFRSRYTGIIEFTPIDAVKPVHLEYRVIENASTAGPHQRVNYDMLKRQDLPIRFFANLDLFEDDLHDSGMSKLSAKCRVMDTAFFVLLRHVVRIDGSILLVRDVRIYHEFALSPPTVVTEEVERRITLDELVALNPTADREALRRLMAKEDELLGRMRTTFERVTTAELPH